MASDLFYSKSGVDALLASIDAAIAQNSSDIGTNGSDIAANAADIAQNASDISALQADTGWINLDFNSGYQSYGSYTCQMREKNGVVYAVGLLSRTSGTFASATQYADVATIPSGISLPPVATFLTAMTTTGVSNAALHVSQTTGNVTVRTGPTPATSDYVGFFFSYLVD